MKNSTGAVRILPADLALITGDPTPRWAVMSTPERQIMSILGEAVEYCLAEERATFLDKACAGDPDRRARIEELLRAHQAAGNFLARFEPERQAMAIMDRPTTCLRCVLPDQPHRSAMSFAG